MEEDREDQEEEGGGQPPQKPYVQSTTVTKQGRAGSVEGWKGGRVEARKRGDDGGRDAPDLVQNLILIHTVNQLHASCDPQEGAQWLVHSTPPVVPVSAGGARTEDGERSGVSTRQIKGSSGMIPRGRARGGCKMSILQHGT